MSPVLLITLICAKSDNLISSRLRTCVLYYQFLDGDAAAYPRVAMKRFPTKIQILIGNRKAKDKLIAPKNAKNEQLSSVALSRSILLVMGVVQLWTLLDSAREKTPLESLSGQVLAVDLSGWICEASALRATSGVVAKPHLRTLFFRVAQLCRLNVRLVFVCDGNAIALKHDTIARRINQRKGIPTAAKASTQNKSRASNRSQLKRLVNEVCAFYMFTISCSHGHNIAQIGSQTFTDTC